MKDEQLDGRDGRMAGRFPYHAPDTAGDGELGQRGGGET